MLNVRTHTSCIVTAKINKLFCDCIDMELHIQVGSLVILLIRTCTMNNQCCKVIVFQQQFLNGSKSLLSKHYNTKYH